MTYRIVWKKHNVAYTEYKDAEGLKSVIDFLERNLDNGYELVSITPNEE